MLSLENPAWQNLADAYGSASEIPNLLRHLAANPDDEAAWNDAWSSLCHQETIYSASIAATPHLVNIARSLPPRQRLTPLILVGSIAANIGKPPVVVYGDKEFIESCSEAVKLLTEAIESGEIRGDDFRYSLGALAGLLGEAKLANVLDKLDCYTECPNCGAQIEPLESTSSD